MRHSNVRSFDAQRPMANDELISRVPSIATERPMESLSTKYSFVPTLNAVNFLRDANWVPVAAEAVRCRVASNLAYAKHMIRFTQPGLEIPGHRFDLILINSHDGGSAFQLLAGIYRQVCSNGLMVSSDMAAFSHRHINFNPDKFIESAGEIAALAPTLAGRIEDWSAIEMDRNEQGIFAKAALQIGWDGDKPSPITADSVLRPRRWDDASKNDLWTTMNRVQENLLKGGVRGRNEQNKRTTTREVKSIDRKKGLNQALWTLTQEMAALKTAA
jgi:hypothetical protein